MRFHYFERKHHLIIDWDNGKVIDDFWKWHRIDKYHYNNEVPDISNLLTKERFGSWGCFIDEDQYFGAEDEPFIDLSDEEDDRIHWPKSWSDMHIFSDRLSA